MYLALAWLYSRADIGTIFAVIMLSAAVAWRYAPMNEMHADKIIELLEEIRDELREARPFSLNDTLSRLVAVQSIPLPPQKPAGSAYMIGPLPDPTATPGATNPDVTDATLKATIGTTGWTATVRPPTSYTDPLKQQKMIEYGCTGAPADYELDHLVPLCCGGHPTDERNLWPQPRAGLLGAGTKDLTEVAAQHAVLNGIYPLAMVQTGFMSDWVKLHSLLFGNKSVVKLMMVLPPPEQEP